MIQSLLKLRIIITKKMLGIHSQRSLLHSIMLAEEQRVRRAFGGFGGIAFREGGIRCDYVQRPGRRSARELPATLQAEPALLFERLCLIAPLQQDLSVLFQSSAN